MMYHLPTGLPSGRFAPGQAGATAHTTNSVQPAVAPAVGKELK